MEIQPEEIRTFIIEYLEQNNILPDRSDSFAFLEQGYIDSMELYVFTVELEERFDITFKDEEILSQEFGTIGGLIHIIKQKLSNG